MDSSTNSTNLDFQKLFESVPGLYLVVAADEQFTIVAVSDAYLRATMTQRDQILGRGIFDVFPDNPGDPSATGEQNVRASLTRVLRNAKPDTIDVQKYDIRRPESEGGGFEERYWSPINTPVFDAQRRVTHIIHRVEDVTDFVRLKTVQAEKDRKTEELQRRALEMEAEIFQRAKELAETRVAANLLQQSETRLRELADAMPQIVWAARPDGMVDYYNRRWYDFTGFSPKQEGDITWEPILHPDDVAPCRKAWFAAVQSGLPYEIEYRFRDRSTDGYRWFLGRALPVRDDQGRIIRWYGTSTDIDDRKRSENELQTARDAAEEANNAKDQFLAVLSHELRTPLTPVLLTVSLMEQANYLAVDLREDVHTIRQNVELEARLIDDLLDLTRVTQGKLQLYLETADVHVLLKSALQICCADRMSDITLNLDADHHHVQADPGRLQQILWNVLNNAVKFTPIGSSITIRSMNVGKDSIRIEVADQGIGIEEHVLPTIFNAFQQGDASLTRAFGGLGLGLTISKALAEAHGGMIQAKSEGKGRGAVITIELPTVAATMSPETVLIPSPAKQSSPPLRILLVEDHAGTLSAMTKLLRGLGHDVRTATNVKDALASAEKNGVDLVISDLGLPDGSGHDLMRALKSRYSIRGIAVSGFGMDDDVRESMEAGFAKHLTKPVDLQKLQIAIREVS